MPLFSDIKIYSAFIQTPETEGVHASTNGYLLHITDHTVMTLVLCIAAWYDIQRFLFQVNIVHYEMNIESPSSA